MDKKILALLGAVLLGTGMNAQAVPFIIDDFTDAQQAQWDPHSSGGGTPTVPVLTGTDTNGPLSPLGGSPFDDRTLSVTLSSNPDEQQAEITSGTGVLSVSKGPNSLATWYAEYTAAVGIDFTQGGSLHQLAFQVNENNAPFADLLFTVVDSLGNMASLSVLNIPFIPTGSPQLFIYNFSDFIQDGGNSADAEFADVTLFRVDIDGSQVGNGVDLQLAFFATTTDAVSPGPLALLGFGLIGLVIARRKANA